MIKSKKVIKKLAKIRGYFNKLKIAKAVAKRRNKIFKKLSFANIYSLFRKAPRKQAREGNRSAVNVPNHSKSRAEVFLSSVIRPTLNELGLSSKNAEMLLLGTAIQESHLKYRTQLGGGPALSYFQIEPATHNDIWKNYLAYRPDLARKVQLLMQSGDKLSELKTNDKYACAIARIHYLRTPEAIPASYDIKAMAHYWKKYYNTGLGKGKASHYIENWKKYGV